MTPHDAALAVSCQHNGILTNVLYDELGIGPSLRQGCNFVSVVAGSSVRKAKRFLRTIQGSDSALDWQLNVALPNGVAPFFFSGCASELGVLVIATKEPFSVAMARRVLGGTAGYNLSPALLKLSRQAASKAKAAPSLTDLLSRVEKEELRTPAPDVRLTMEQSKWLEIAAHDLRNPASGILAACQYLLEDSGQFQEHQINLLKSISSSSRRMLLTIEDMLEMPAIETGGLRLSRRTTDIAGLVEQSVAIHRPPAEQKKIQLELSAEPLPRLKVDPVRIRQALNSLLANAVSSSDPESRVEIRLGTRDESVFIAVHNGGPGMAFPDLKSFLNQSDPGARKPKLREARLALILKNVTRIVEGHHGKVEVEAHDANGSTITLLLPFATTARRPMKGAAGGKGSSAVVRRLENAAS